MKEKIKTQSFLKKIDYGIRLAVAKALAEHKRKGQSIFLSGAMEKLLKYRLRKSRCRI